MKEKEIRKLIKLLEESGISELEVSRWGRRVRISKVVSARSASPSPYEPSAHAPPASVPPPAEKDVHVPSTPEDHVKADRFHRIVSPMPGTFYRAPSPDVESFVQEGEHVTPGQTVCIIEAMKLMNEIESDVSGTIMEILVQDAEPVEYGQPLFLVRPD